MPTEEPVTATGNGEPLSEGTPGAPRTMLEFLESLPDESNKVLARGLFDTETRGLKTALESERASRKEFEKQLRDLKPLAEKGSDLEKKLEELSVSSEQKSKDLERQLDFYREGVRQGVADLDLAWMAINRYELYDRKGNPDFAALKEHYPALFSKGEVKPPVPKANVGAGAGGEGAPQTGGMNEWLRRQARG